MELLEPIPKNEIQFVDTERRHITVIDYFKLLIGPQIQIHEIVFTSMSYLGNGYYYNGFQYSLLALEEQLYIDSALRIKTKLSKVAQAQELNQFLVHLLVYLLIMVILVFQDTIIDTSCGEGILEFRNIQLMALSAFIYILAEIASNGNQQYAIALVLPIEMIIVQFACIMGRQLSVGQVLIAHCVLGLFLLILCIFLNFKFFSLKNIGQLSRFREILLLALPEICADISNCIVDTVLAAETFAQFSYLSLTRGMLYNYYCSLKSSMHIILDTLLPMTKDFYVESYAKYFVESLFTMIISAGAFIFSLLFIENLLFGSHEYEDEFFYISIFVGLICEPFIHIMEYKLFSLGMLEAVEQILAFHFLLASYVFYASYEQPWMRGTFFMNMMIGVCEIIFLAVILTALHMAPLIPKCFKKQ